MFAKFRTEIYSNNLWTLLLLQQNLFEKNSKGTDTNFHVRKSVIFFIDI